ncbi:MAG: hypothetical protein AAF430_11040 [Myxococcota bacterium]
MRFRIRSASRVAAAIAVALLLPAFSAQGRGADGDFDERRSAHFVLYQDVDIDQAGGFHGSRRFEQQVLADLERAYESVDRWLGLRPNRLIEVVVYDPGAFDHTYRGLFRFPAAGFYHGVIRIRGATRMTDDLSRVLHHELVHAALDAAAPSLLLPGWVNEGTAEWFEARVTGKRGLSSRERDVLAALARSGELPPLATLNTPAFGGFAPRAAQIAYLQSYGLIDYLNRHHGERKLSQFLAELIRKRNLDRALKRVYRMDAEKLEERFFRELGV